MHRIGVIGLGAMGALMARQFMEDSRFHVAAAWDMNAERGHALREEFPALAIAADAQALVMRDDVDMVYIATPPASHVGYCHLALDHGKAILCEKPLSTDRAAAQELVQRVQAGTIPGAVNFLFGLSPMVAVMEDALRAGAVGEVRAVEVRMHFPKWPREWQRASDWLAQRSEGGFVREVFSHYAYLIDRLCGPLTVTARQIERDRSAAEVGVHALLRSGDAPVRFIGTAGGAAPELIEWTLYGSRRSYRILDWNTLQESDGGEWQTVPWADADPSPRPLDELAKMLSGQGHRLADFAAALRAQETIESLVG
jgi:predicted dehydrogenase